MLQAVKPQPIDYYWLACTLRNETPVNEV